MSAADRGRRVGRSLGELERDRLAALVVGVLLGPPVWLLTPRPAAFLAVAAVLGPVLVAAAFAPAAAGVRRPPRRASRDDDAELAERVLPFLTRPEHEAGTPAALFEEAVRSAHRDVVEVDEASGGAWNT
jgi:hypothetical protein